jgi:copper resistance protein B
LTGRRRALALTLGCLALPAGVATAWAQTQMSARAMQGGSPPPDARDPDAYSDGVDFTRGDARPTLGDRSRLGSILIDNLEPTRVGGDTVVPYAVEAWFGQTYDRAVLKAEGDFDGGGLAEARTELLWGHAVAPYWDTQVGMRHDGGRGPDRTWLAAGIQGLAPYWFDLEVTGYLGESSRTALRVDASYEMLMTQRLILQPRLEANFYGKQDPERGLGSGLSDTALALRLRYEVRRELAPYVGVEWINRYGGTEDAARAAGEDDGDLRFLLGLRFWF